MRTLIFGRGMLGGATVEGEDDADTWEECGLGESLKLRRLRRVARPSAQRMGRLREAL